MIPKIFSGLIGQFGKQKTERLLKLGLGKEKALKALVPNFDRLSVYFRSFPHFKEHLPEMHLINALKNENAPQDLRFVHEQGFL
ncbi:hypothetical protein [Estrella lausannensis]|uniref:Uncharacterized protein n=1 Tax=Estrella lausannensis TaxID=483423 RepID=A0A0H5DN84_9BACT|nr:hypothetical protein [Estrella lausannensis]CRX37736.1 hypothetical protein ELAC_0375 [Estrella lausannensis]